MLEKVLNVSSSLGTKELAVRFGCLEAEQLARDVLERSECSLVSGTQLFPSF